MTNPEPGWSEPARVLAARPADGYPTTGIRPIPAGTSLSTLAEGLDSDDPDYAAQLAARVNEATGQ